MGITYWLGLVLDNDGAYSGAGGCVCVIARCESFACGEHDGHIRMYRGQPRCEGRAVLTVLSIAMPSSRRMQDNE